MTANEDSNPFTLFHDWYTEALKLDVKEPNYMTLSTATKEGKPSSRIVLLKHFDEKGFVFFTNLTSRKGKEIHDNPFAALGFYWPPLNRQVRIEGMVEKVSERESDDYFASRSRGSQIGAWASKQSCNMETEHSLAERVEEICQQFEGAPIPRPPFWGGCRVIPTHMEFWQEGENRLHTRICFERDSEHAPWQAERLYP